MTDDIQRRFLRDNIPVRMGNMASNLGRIQAIGEIDGRATTIAAVIDETIQFVNWTLSDADSDKAFVLAELKQDLSKWHATIHTMWNDPAQRSLLCNQAGDWSERLVLASGLV